MDLDLELEHQDLDLFGGGSTAQGSGFGSGPTGSSGGNSAQNVQLVSSNGQDSNLNSASNGYGRWYFLKSNMKEWNYLNKSKKPIKIKELQLNVWDHKSLLETHTVETHIHRLRKKIKEKFNDENFIKSSKEGYFINWKRKIWLQKIYLQKNTNQE